MATYQIHIEQLKRQQEILKALGFYSGKIDGVWGPQSIEAKRKFEALPSFLPGLPNNGLPFGDPPYPAGIYLAMARHRGEMRLLNHPLLEKAKVKQVEASTPTQAPEKVSKKVEVDKEKSAEP